MKISQIQGQSYIMSFLAPKLFSMTPSTESFPNSSNQIDYNTTAVCSCDIYVGSKTKEASNSTGGEAQQLSGRTNDIH